MSGVAIAGIPESVWVTIRERTGEWGSQAYCSNCNWSEVEGHLLGVTKGVQDDRAWDGGGASSAEWISGAYRHGSQGRILTRQQSYRKRCVGRLLASPTVQYPLMSIGGSGRVDRDAAFFRSGVRPVTVMQPTGLTIRAVIPILLRDLQQIFDMLFTPEGRDPTIYGGR